MTVTVMRPLKAAWVAADVARAAAPISAAPFRTCSTIFSAISWVAVVAAAAMRPSAATTCAITCGSSWKMPLAACRKRSTCRPQWRAGPAREPGPKVDQSHRPVPPVPAWARSVRSRASSRLNAPARPVPAWARPSRTPARPATAKVASRRKNRSPSTSQPVSKPAPAFVWQAKARRGCAAAQQAIFISSSRCRITNSSNGMDRTFTAACRCRLRQPRWVVRLRCPPSTVAAAG